jgi:KAP family P-loop domain
MEEAKLGSVANANASAEAPAQSSAGSFVPADLDPEPPGVLYDSELERLCRIAASIGGTEPAPISYTALVVAFLFSDDAVSKWFQQYVKEHDIRVGAIYSGAKTTAVEKDRHLARASSRELPSVQPMYSQSVRDVMQRAAHIARDMTGQVTTPVLSPCHLMAAYAFRNPDSHRSQVHEWGFDEKNWQDAFLQFAQQTLPNQRWSRLRGSITTVSSFTADDPLAAAVDLLGVEDEAAAFARVAAAISIKPPLAIGIFGEWGSGKTFFMKRIYENVQALTKRAESHTNKTLFHTDIVQIRFNAWHYIETNLWASLVEYIFAELDRWLLEKTQNARPEADLVFNRLATAQQLKLDALESVVSRRAERRSAELRAERARREYEQAAARSAALGAGTYARAFLSTVLTQNEVKQQVARIGRELGAPELVDNADRVIEVLEQGRTEAGRIQLQMRAGREKLGTWPWIAAILLALVGAPMLAVALKDYLARLTGWDGLASIHDTVLAISGLLAGAAAWGQTLFRQTSKVVQRVDEFEKRLRDEVARQVKAADDPSKKTAAEDELRKRRQDMEAAERALADADARLTAARQDFESATARSRLNAFIRAKATEGDYAKHLGIIAAIRRDFGQLAALMGAANDSAEQQRESERLAVEANTRVARFLDWLSHDQEVRLTPGELRSLLSLVRPEEAVAILTKQRKMLEAHLETSAGDLVSIENELKAVQVKPLPKFSRIILYIDDLDRCPPETVVKVLQAVHLLLTFPLFTVVVAVDARWISRALREQFPNLLTETGMFAGNSDIGKDVAAKREATMEAGASSHDYLEKIFQIPYWVRPIDDSSARTYVDRLVEPDIRASTATTSGHGASPSAPNQGASTQATGGQASSTGTGDVQTTSQPQDEEVAASLELTRWEADALQQFAPLVGATPRRLIRFVNVYRLIKTSLRQSLLEQVGAGAEGELYRALVLQLAVVTGAPVACQHYFAAIEALKDDQTLIQVIDKLKGDTLLQSQPDRETVRKILEVATAAKYGSLKVSQLRVSAPIARRYSFTARPNQST